MRAITVIKICVASLVLLMSTNSNAEMVRLDFKGRLDDSLVSRGALADIAAGDKFQGYFLINTDAPHVTTDIDPWARNEVGQIVNTQLDSDRGIPVFVDGSISIGNRTFEVSALEIPYQQSIITTGADYHIYSYSFSGTGVTLGIDLRLVSPSISAFTGDLVPNYSVLTDPLTSMTLGVLYNEPTLGGAHLEATGTVEEATLVPVPVPASVWLLGSALLVLCLSAVTRKASRARQYSLVSPQAALPA